MKKVFLSFVLSFSFIVVSFCQIPDKLDTDLMYQITLDGGAILEDVIILNQETNALFVYFKKEQRRIEFENIVSIKNDGKEYMEDTFLATHYVELIDDTKFIAKIISIDSTQLIVSTVSAPNIVIDKTKIKSIEKLGKNSVKNGKYWFPNPNATRYFFAPSAFTLKKGEGYYQNTYLVINSFNVGVTDHITVGGGFELFSFLDFGGPISVPSYFITPKIGYEVAKNVNVAGGVLFANMNNGSRFEERSRTNMGIAYGVGTFGSENNNFTVGSGWGFIDGEFSKKPVFTISGMTRAFRRVAFVTENWIVLTNDEYSGIASYGVRFFGEKMSVDVGFLKPLEKDPFFNGILGIPYADFVIKF